MRSNIDKDGNMNPAPRTLQQAHDRRQQLGVELERIDAQLADPVRRRFFQDDATFEEWKKRAQTARRLFAEEASQLRGWIACAEQDLFRDARDLLSTLQEDLGEDMVKEERDVVRLLREFLLVERDLAVRVPVLLHQTLPAVDMDSLRDSLAAGVVKK